ncbi:MAG: SwmB domain-containing protein [Patescibacteria group bacterium]
MNIPKRSKTTGWRFLGKIYDNKYIVLGVFLLVACFTFFGTIRAAIIDDSNPPILQSFTSSPSSGTHLANSVITITANFDEDLDPGSTMNVQLDTGQAIDLVSDEGDLLILHGNYTVAQGEASSDLTITAINSANITDLDTAPNNSTSYSIPEGQNLGDNSAVIVDAVAPGLSSAGVEGSTLTLTYSEALDGSPSVSEYDVYVNSSPVSISSVNVTGSTVVLTLASPVDYDDVVTIDYEGSGTVKDIAGNDAGSLSGQSVTNNDTDNPDLSAATVNGATLTLTYNEALDTGSTPATGDFVVNVEGSPVSISSVNVTGSTVVLALASPVGMGDTVNISYSPGDNPIQDYSAGNNAGLLSEESVTNNTDTAPPVLSDAGIDGATLTLTYDEPLNAASSTLSTGDFVVDVNSSPVSISSVNVTGSTVVLTLASPVDYDDVVTIDYTPPGGNGPIQDMAGNDATSLSSESVTNNTEETPPVLSTAVVNGATLSLTYGEALDDDSVPATTDFVVNVNGSPVLISTVSISGSVVLVALGNNVGSGNSVTINYTPGVDRIQDGAGSDAASLSGQSVTNNTETTVPVLSYARVNGNTLTLTYNEALDTGSTPATGDFVVNVDGSPVSISTVSISGSAVILVLASSVDLSDVLTIDYDVPLSNPTQDVPGNNAASLSEVSVHNVTDACSTIEGDIVGAGFAVVGRYVYTSSSVGVAVIDTTTDIATNINIGHSVNNFSIVGTKLYVTGTSTVSVINTNTNTVIATIPVGSTTGSQVNTVVGTKLYVNNFGSSTVSVINTNTNTVIATIPTGVAPMSSTVVGTKLYVNNYSSSFISIINTLTDSNIGNIPTTGNVYESFAVGTNLYANVTTAARVAVIDTTTDTITTTVQVGTLPYYSLLADTKLYVNNNGSNTVSVININTNTVTATIPVGASPRLSILVGTKLYVGNADSHFVSVIDTDTNSVIQNIYLPGFSVFSAVVGTKMYVSNNNNVSVIDTTTDGLFNVCTPHLTSITSTSANDTYTSGQSVNITANFNEALGPGSKMRLTLNTGAVVNLTVVSGSTLSGTYVVGSGETSPDLSVSSISSNASFTSVSDTDGTPNIQSSFSVPASPELTGDTYRNLGDLKDIVIGTAYPNIDSGTEPYQLTTVGNIVYVANQGSDSVTVIDTTDNSVIATTAVGDQPYGLAYNSTSKEVYVANLKGDSVSVIDADPLSGTYNDVINTISVGVEPYYVTSLGTKMYVTNSVSWTVSVINTATHTVTNTINVGAWPRGIKAHGTDLYVANFGSNYGGSSEGTVSVINSSNNTVTDTIIVGSGPRGVAVNGNEVYVSNWNDNTVSVISTTSNTVTYTISVGSGPRGILSLGSNIYVENYKDGTISVIATGSHSVTGTYKVGNTPAGMTAVGTDIYISLFTDDVVSIFDTVALSLKSSVVPDTTAPVISSVASSTGQTTASISFVTNELATSTLDYGLTTSYGTASSSSASATSTVFNLTGLTAGSTYHFRISVWDASSNLATSSDYTLTTTAASSGGGTTDPQLNPGTATGGGGGGGAVIYYPTPVASTTAITLPNTCRPGDLFSILTGARCQITSTTTPVATVVLPAINLFYRDLKIGMTGSDIQSLQKFLNALKFKVSIIGPGSPGNETSYFGPATKSALVKFQGINGIPATGFFGPITRAFTNKFLK